MMTMMRVKLKDHHRNKVIFRIKSSTFVTKDDDSSPFSMTLVIEEYLLLADKDDLHQHDDDGVCTNCHPL